MTQGLWIVARSGGEEIQWKMKLKGGDLYNLGICSASVLGCFFSTGNLEKNDLFHVKKLMQMQPFFVQNSSPIKGFGTAGYEIQAPTGAKWHTCSQLRVCVYFHGHLPCSVYHIFGRKKHIYIYIWESRKNVYYTQWLPQKKSFMTWLQDFANCIAELQTPTALAIGRKACGKRFALQWLHIPTHYLFVQDQSSICHTLS